jgi:hypothetical protein
MGSARRLLRTAAAVLIAGIAVLAGAGAASADSIWGTTTSASSAAVQR